MIYLGHLSFWFILFAFLTAIGKAKVKGENPLIVWLVFAMIFAIPSCTINVVFFK